MTLPEGERVQVSVPEVTVEIQRRLAALDACDAACEGLTKEQQRLLDEAVQRRPWFEGRKLDL